MSEDTAQLLIARFDELIICLHALGIMLFVALGVVVGLLLNSRR